MTAFSYSNADALFTNLTALEDGAAVLVRWNDLKTWLTGGNIVSSNMSLISSFPWTGIHSWTITNTSNHNRALTVGGVMAVNKYGEFITSAATQINAPLIVHSLTGSSSTVSVEEVDNAGTGDSHKVVNTNTGACYHASTSSTGDPFHATVRSLTGLHAPLVSNVIVTPTTVTNDATETIVGDLDVTVPALFLQAGTTIKGTIYGTLDTPGAGPATLEVMVKWGGTAGVKLLDSGIITPAISLVKSMVKLEFILTCITTGATGTIESQGHIHWNSNTLPVVRGMGLAGTGAGNSTPVVIDTTTQKDLVVSVKWGTAVVGCTISMRAGVIEVKK